MAVRNASSTLYKFASRLDTFGAQTVWQEFTPLATELNAINLGQGFPDWASPRFVKDAMCRAVEEDFNQYTRSAGHMNLVKALAKHYTPILGKPLDPLTDIAIGVGSSEILFACMQTLVDANDEVILISPAFDIYSAQVVMAGGKCVYVPLRLKTNEQGTLKWTLDMSELRAAFSSRTRLLVINTPQNPTGKVLNMDELLQLSEILLDFPNVAVLSDEVYENMMYDDQKFIRLATLPGMWERTITISSSGKTFSTTGWKIGWAIGPKEFIRGIILTNQWVQFSVSTPAQQAIAYCFERASQPYEGYPTFYAWLQAQYTAKRDKLCAGLKAAGLPPITPEGSFFIMADTTAVKIPQKYLDMKSDACGPIMRRDWAFCKFLAYEIGVVAIPISAFYEEKDKHLSDGVARFAFCKEDASLDEACKRLLKLREYLV